jgi:acyl-ACP thioesterase
MTTSQHSILTLSEEFTVRSYDVDCTGRLRPTALFNYFQDIAGRHATTLGLGYTALQGTGHLWVLSRAKVRIVHMPVWEETVQITTWPKGQDGLLFLREFSMNDRKGAALALGTTGWLFLDAATGRPQGAQALPIPLPLMPQKHALEEPLRKLKPPENFSASHTRTVLQSDIDVNNHVNTARYVDWVMDTYDIGFLSAHPLRSLQMNYLGESHAGDAITLHRESITESPHTDFLEGVNDKDGAKVVQALVEWA